MVIVRALLVATVFFMAQGVASAQTGGIRVAPVLVSLSPERAIGSLRLHNGRATSVSFEVEAFVWTQVGGEDRLTPTNALIVAPGVFEIAPNSEQTLRLGVRGPSSNSEAAYRILLRELPAPRSDGVALGFALEMSLPVFVTPSGARPNLTTHAEGQHLILTNTGSSFAQIALLNGDQRLEAPRYLLAGSSAPIALPAPARAIRLIEAHAGGQQSERTINVGQSAQHASVR